MMPSTPNITVASQVACTDTPHGPCRPSTGMASRVNAASQPKTATAQATPMASVRPSPWTRPGACRHDQRGGHRRGLRAGPLQQRADQGQHGGDAGHGHAEDGGFGVPGPLDQRQVEHHQAGHGDAGQPQPLRFARPGQPSPGDPGQRDEDQAGHPVPDRFGGVHRRPGQHRGDRDAAAHADHGGRARGHAGGRAAVRGGTFGRGPGRGSDAALDSALGAAAGTDGAPAGRPGTSGARRPGTTLRYWSDGPANRAIVADL